MSTDTRIAELEALAQEEGLTLPYPVDLILWFEDRSYVIDLNTGVMYRNVSATPTRSARAVVHLLAETDGDISL
jgi:hypothetical protein